MKSKTILGADGATKMRAEYGEGYTERAARQA